jgi:hypothetical protein
MALQAVHRQVIHRLAIHRRRHCAYINVALLSKRPSPSRCHQAVHRQAIALSIAEPSVAESFIAVTIKPSIAIALLRRRRVASSHPSPLRCRRANHSQALAPSIAKPSITEPFITVAVAVALPSTSRCHHNVHCRCVSVKLSIAKPSRHPLLSHP